MVVSLRTAVAYFRGQELQLWEMAAERRVPLIGNSFAGPALQFSEDSKTLVSLGNFGQAILWLDVESGKGNVKKTETQFGSGRSYPYPEVFALTDDKIAIGWDDGKIQLWDPKTGKTLLTLDGHAMPTDMSDDNEVLALAFFTRWCSSRQWKQGQNSPIMGYQQQRQMDYPSKTYRMDKCVSVFTEW